MASTARKMSPEHIFEMIVREDGWREVKMVMGKRCLGGFVMMGGVPHYSLNGRTAGRGSKIGSRSIPLRGDEGKGT